jgi:hypothetical protein
MSGTVGASLIRNDARKDLIDGTPKTTNQRFVEDGQRIRRADLVQPEFLSRTTTVATITEFYNLLKRVFQAATENDGTYYDLRFTKEYPPEMAPRFMYESEDPDYPGEMVQEYFLRQQNEIELTVWAKNNSTATEIAEWAENKYWEYLWALQWGGIAHPIRWMGRKKDNYEEVRNQSMNSSTMTLQVITGTIIKKRATILRKLQMSLGLLIED